MFGDVLFGQGDISMELVKQGIARVGGWSLEHTTKDHADRLLVAQRAAQAAKKGIWVDYKAPEITGTKVSQGTVVEVVSGDTLVVATDAGEDTKVSLSSVRAPRLGRRDGSGAEEWAREAKEFMRQTAIGRRVEVNIDYERAPGPASAPTGPTRAYATVSLVGRKGVNNLGELIMAAGLADVQRHRADDPRSAAYDKLLAAETLAKNSKRRKHSGKAPAKQRVIDLVGNSTKAHSYLTFLKRDRSNHATVEYVHAGGRCKIHIQEHNCYINFSFSGVRCPSAPYRGGGKAAAAAGGAGGAAGASASRTRGRAAEPFGAEAQAFFRSMVNQRDVDVEVVDMDRAGCVLGHMFIGAGKQRRNVAAVLLERGLARTTGMAASRSRYATELFAAEEKAKAARKGVWKDYKEPTAEELRPSGPELVDVTVVHLDSGNTFYVHKKSQASRLKVRTDCPTTRWCFLELSSFALTFVTLCPLFVAGN